MNQQTHETPFLRAPIAVILAWLIPGLGHLYLGQRIRGLIFFVTITLTFGTGVAIGGVKSISPRPTAGYDQEATIRSLPTPSHPLWFMAQLLNGAYAIGAYEWGTHLPAFDPDTGKPRYLSWPSGDIGAVYTGVSGLLNLLIILDVLARAEGFWLFRKNSWFSVEPTKGGGGG